MADGLNRAILIGNLGAEPELSYTQAGRARLRLRLATNRVFVNKERERQQRTDWHTVIVWGKRAEALNKILDKGRAIAVEGRIETRNYENPKGDKRWITEIVARDLMLLGGGRGGGGASVPEHAEAPPLAAAAGGEDDIPF